MAAGTQVSSVQPETTTEYSPRSSVERELSSLALGETEVQNDKLACLLKVAQLINDEVGASGPQQFLSRDDYTVSHHGNLPQTTRTASQQLPCNRYLAGLEPHLCTK